MKDFHWPSPGEVAAAQRRQEQKLTWIFKERGWWEAEGKAYRYRAVQRTSRSWDLMVFGEGLEATADYPATLSDCKSYAAYLESGRYVIQDGTLRRAAR